MWLSGSTLIDVGVDYYTATSVDGPTTTLLLLKGENLTYQREREGFLIKPWRFRDYRGWRCGGVEWGARDYEGIVRLSGNVAASHWWDLYQISQRCTRIDLQATLKCSGDVNRELLHLHQQLLDHQADSLKPATVTLWSNNTGGLTVYFGKRTSPLYFRAYNKGAQSELEEYLDCLRLELECKDFTCTSVIAHLIDQPTVQNAILGCLSKFLTDRGSSTNFAGAGPCSFYEHQKGPSDLVKLLEWIHTQVRPSVTVLLDNGLLNETLDSLGLSAFATGGTSGGPSGPID